MQVNYTSFDRAVGYNCKNKKKPFYLIKPIFVIVSYANKKLYLRLDDPKFTSDGCTLWKIFWLILGCPHSPEYLPASIIHDYILDNPHLVHYHRELASQIFKTTLLKEGVSLLKAQIMYIAVDFWQWLKNFRTRKWR